MVVEIINCHMVTSHIVTPATCQYVMWSHQPQVSVMWSHQKHVSMHHVVTPAICQYVMWSYQPQVSVMWSHQPHVSMHHVVTPATCQYFHVVTPATSQCHVVTPATCQYVSRGHTSQPHSFRFQIQAVDTVYSDAMKCCPGSSALTMSTPPYLAPHSSGRKRLEIMV